MKLPSSMTTSSPHDVCKLRRSLYGLKQVPRAWFEKFRSTLLSFSFTQSQYDSSLFLHTSTSGIVILMVYVDDIIITGTDCVLITKLQQLLHATFHMKDLGQLTYFLGLEVHYRSHGLFVNQHKYIQDLITLEDTSFVDTPMEVNVKYKKDEGDLLDEPTLYRRLVGSLIYLTTTQPNISYVRNKIVFLNPLLRLSIVPFLLLVLKLYGYVVSLRSLGFLRLLLLLFMLITLVLFRLPPILFSMNAPSTLKLIVILFETLWKVG